ncbi:MAG: hypothetical protein H6Q34_1213, partial [Deltaproteobacteria bacterium]|nr:hypothetical protein [Deltaproteobacteria bacterium]
MPRLEARTLLVPIAVAAIALALSSGILLV